MTDGVSQSLDNMTSISVSNCDSVTGDSAMSHSLTRDDTLCLIQRLVSCDGLCVRPEELYLQPVIENLRSLVTECPVKSHSVSH